METTLVPFATLPPCATLCGHLYDANGACVPPAAPTAAPTVYDACFCADTRLAPFSTGTAGVCDNACTAPGEQGGLASIQAWYTSFCSVNGKAVATTTAGAGAGTITTTTAGSGATGATGAGTAASNSGGGGTWLSTHYQWVIFIVVVVVGIVVIWVGACIWRRHYLRKKDREYALGKSRASGAGAAASMTSAGGGHHTGHDGTVRSAHLPQAGMFMPASLSAANVYDVEKPQEKERRRWVVTERT